MKKKILTFLWHLSSSSIMYSLFLGYMTAYWHISLIIFIFGSICSYIILTRVAVTKTYTMKLSNIIETPLWITNMRLFVLMLLVPSLLKGSTEIVPLNSFIFPQMALFALLVFVFIFGLVLSYSYGSLANPWIFIFGYRIYMVQATFINTDDSKEIVLIAHPKCVYNNTYVNIKFIDKIFDNKSVFILK